MDVDPQSASTEGSRYWKFAWNNLTALPAIGATDYQPKGRLTRAYSHGEFIGEKIESFPAVKTKRLLSSLGCCAFCGRDKDEVGNKLRLTSEHIIPEFLGAGLELPDASCPDCQQLTASFESSIAEEMFDPVRKSFNIRGKGGVISNNNFPLDVGREITDKKLISISHFPTILVMPLLNPAPSYSKRPKGSVDPRGIMLYNINANEDVLNHHDIGLFSTQAIDAARFAQMIAKIAHVYAIAHFGAHSFTPTLTSLIRTDFPPAAPAAGYFDEIGSLPRAETPTENFHELEAGHLTWGDNTMKAVRVRLFASYGMPSYYVTVGTPSATAGVFKPASSAKS